MLGDSAGGGAVRPSAELQDEQIQLGPVLGQGTFGTVYRGDCFGLAVAVKVPFVSNESADGNGDAATLAPDGGECGTTPRVQPPALSKEDLADLKQEIRIMTYDCTLALLLFLLLC
jgi:hypothetical protein